MNSLVSKGIEVVYIVLRSAKCAIALCPKKVQILTRNNLLLRNANHYLSFQGS